LSFADGDAEVLALRLPFSTFSRTKSTLKNPQWLD
jgi:hypothetical protein